MAPRISQNFSAVLEAAAETWWRETIHALPGGLQGFFGFSRWWIFEGEILPPESTRPVALALPGEEILVRRIELPLMSRFQLPRLMRFEAPRHIPLPVEQARWDYRIVARDFAASRMVVELAMTRSSVVEAAEAAAKAAGLDPEAVLLHTAQGSWRSRRLLARPWREAWRRRVRILFFRAAIPVVLIFALVLGAQNWADRLAASRDAAVVIAREQAAGVAPLRQQFAQIDDKITFLAAARQEPSAAVIAEEVARILPDNAWLQELDIEPQTIRLAGTSQQATGLLRIFSSSPLFGNVQFEAPLTPASGSSGDQFDLVMTRN